MSLSTIRSLKSLDLGYNKFDEIDFNFENLTNLQFIKFGGCENFAKIDITKLIKPVGGVN